MAKLGFIGLGVMGSQMVDSSAQQRSHRDRLQPHPRQSAVAGGKRHAVGRLAPRSRSRLRLHLRHGHQLGRNPGRNRRSRRIARRPDRRKNFHRHEHGEPRGEPRSRRESPRPRRRHGRLAGLRQRHHAAGRQAVSDGRRTQRNFRKDQASASRHRSEGHTRRRQRPRALHEDRHQPEPRRADAGIFRRRAARGKKRHRPRSCGRRAHASAPSLRR